MSKTFKFSCIFFCIAVFPCIVKEAYSQKEIPKYTIDLDEPAETRWQEIANDFAVYAPFLQKLIRQSFPPAVLPLAEKVALYVDTLFEEPYPGEMKGIAEALNISLPEVILANLYYDLTAYCTSIVAQDEQGNIFHARNLDYGNTVVFRNMSVRVDFLRNGKIAYSGITFAGYIGILTGQKPLAFTVSLDERDKGYVWENILQLLLVKTTPVGFFLRSLLANEDSNFEYAVQQISKVEMIAPSYIIVGGIHGGEGAVVTRARTKALDVWKLNVSEGRWFLVETNYDHWETPPKSDDRRDPAIKAMNQMGQKNLAVKGLFKVMSTQPVLNNSTTFTCIMSAKFPSIFTAWKRKCCT